MLMKVSSVELRVLLIPSLIVVLEHKLTPLSLLEFSFSQHVENSFIFVPLTSGTLVNYLSIFQSVFQ
jgi:hypothetical protein